MSTLAPDRPATTQLQSLQPHSWSPRSLDSSSRQSHCLPPAPPWSIPRVFVSSVMRVARFNFGPIQCSKGLITAIQRVQRSSARLVIGTLAASGSSSSSLRLLWEHFWFPRPGPPRFFQLWGTALGHQFDYFHGFPVPLSQLSVPTLPSNPCCQPQDILF